MFLRLRPDSSRRYWSYFSLMKSMTGCQLQSRRREKGEEARILLSIPLHTHTLIYHTYQVPLFTESPNPGVSTTVSLSFTPFSSMSTVVASILTVCLMRSRGMCMSMCVCVCVWVGGGGGIGGGEERGGG